MTQTYQIRLTATDSDGHQITELKPFTVLDDTGDNGPLHVKVRPIAKGEPDAGMSEGDFVGYEVSFEIGGE